MATRREPHIQRTWSKVIEPASAGHFGLPEVTVTRVREVDSLRSRLADIGDQRAKLSESRARAEVHELSLKAAKEGTPYPGADRIIDARRKAEALDDEAHILTGILELKENHHPPHEEMVRCLQAALDEVVEGVRRVAPLLEKVNFSEEVVAIRGSKPERDALAEYLTLVGRYDAIRSAQLVTHTSSTVGWPNLNSPDQHFLEIENLDSIWPRWRPTPGFGGAPTPPWPSGLRRLAWLVSSEARPWLPDDEQLKETFARLHPERAKQLIQAN